MVLLWEDAIGHWCRIEIDLSMVGRLWILGGLWFVKWLCWNGGKRSTWCSYFCEYC